MSFIERINSSAFSRLDSLLYQWLPDGRVEGAYYVAKNPNRNDANLGSFKINRMTCKWKDFATSDPGGNDPISLYRYVKGISDMAEAAKLLSRDLSLNSDAGRDAQSNYSGPTRKKRKSDPWRPIIPVPEDAEAPSERLVTGSIWVYKTLDGKLIGYVIRRDQPGGVRDFYPLTYCEHSETKKRRWRLRGFPEPRPLYGLDLLKRYPDLPVLIVEGEKTCDAARKLLNGDAVVLTWAGGTNSVEYVDWGPIEGRRVAIWPDNDEVGREAARRIAFHLIDANASVKIVAPPEGVSKSWDLGDALAEGWNIDRVKAHLISHSAVYEKPEITMLVSTDHAEPAPKLQAASAERPERKRITTAELWEAGPSKHSIVARYIADKFESELMFDESRGQWYRFDTVWQHVEPGVIDRLVSDVLSEIYSKFGATHLAGVVKLLRAFVGREPKNAGYGFKDTWNQSRDLLPFENGILRLSDRVLLPHSPDFMFNWTLPYPYDPAAECPVIKRVIENISNGDLSTQQTLLAFLAAVMLGMSDLQKYLEIIGKPGTGKSTFIKIAQDLVGDGNTVTTSMRQLHENRFETANFYGKRLAIIPDADQWGGSVEVLKNITGQDPLRYEEKNRQQGRPFIYRGMVIVSANQAIQSSDASTALARRRVPVFIDRFLKAEEVDHGLFDKIRGQMPGLVNWLLSFDRESIADVLSDADKIRIKHERRSMVETNDIARWANEMLIFDRGITTLIGAKRLDGQRIENSTRDLYPSYVDFCESRGITRIVPHNRFSAALTEICSRYGHEISLHRVASGMALKNVRIRRTEGLEAQADLNIPLLLTDEFLERS